MIWKVILLLASFQSVASDGFSQWFDEGAGCVFVLKGVDKKGVIADCSGMIWADSDPSVSDKKVIIVTRLEQVTLANILEKDPHDNLTLIATIDRSNETSEGTIRFTARHLLREATAYKRFLDKQFDGKCEVSYSGDLEELVAETTCKNIGNLFSEK